MDYVAELGRIGSCWMDLTGLGRTRLDKTGTDSSGLDWNGLDWSTLRWAGLAWPGLTEGMTDCLTDRETDWQAYRLTDRPTDRQSRRGRDSRPGGQKDTRTGGRVRQLTGGHGYVRKCITNHTNDYENVFQTSFNMNKQTRLEYGDSEMTHAMLLTGVDIKKRNSTKWKIENSWGICRNDKKQR